MVQAWSNKGWRVVPRILYSSNASERWMAGQTDAVAIAQQPSTLIESVDLGRGCEWTPRCNNDDNALLLFKEAKHGLLNSSKTERNSCRV